MKKVTVTIASKDYTITLDKSFAASFESDMNRFLGSNKGLDVKELLTAFVQKCYEGYCTQQTLDTVSLKIDDTLEKNNTSWKKDE